jgi:hypothetical protein
MHRALKHAYSIMHTAWKKKLHGRSMHSALKHGHSIVHTAWKYAQSIEACTPNNTYCMEENIARKKHAQCTEAWTLNNKCSMEACSVH